MFLSFAEASFAVGMVVGIKPDRASTFQSRVKQWQKMGFPEGTQVGRGVKAQYGATQVFQLALLVKLLSVGLTPERGQQVIRTAWPRFKGGIVEAIMCHADAEPHLHYFMIRLDALSDLTTEGGSDHMHIFVDVYTETEMLMSWDEAGEDWTEEQKSQHAFSSYMVKNALATSISIEIDSLLMWVWSALNTMGKGPEVFADEIADWLHFCREEGARFQASQEHFERDIFKQSIAKRLDGAKGDPVEYARAALSKASENDLYPKA